MLFPSAWLPIFLHPCRYSVPMDTGLIQPLLIEPLAAVGLMQI